MQLNSYIRLKFKQQAMIEVNQELVFPEAEKCHLSDDKSSFYGSISLRNTSNKTIHYNIISKFCSHLTFTGNKGSVQSNTIQFLRFRIKSETINTKKEEKLIISYSNREIQSFCITQRAKTKSILLFFEDDQSTKNQKIQTQKIKDLQNQAKTLFNHGKFAQSKQKCQEVLNFNRQNSNVLFGLANCSFMLRQLNEAIEYIDLYLKVKPDNIQASILKANIMEELGTDHPRLKPAFLRESANMIRNALEKENIKKIIRLKGERILTRLDRIQDQLYAVESQKNFQKIMEKAKTSFEESDEMKECFFQKTYFESYLNDFISPMATGKEETPQFCLDNLSCQIYKQPVILPTGVSGEKNFLERFFRMYGRKNPYTRVPLEQNEVIPNLALKDFINNNSSLKRWMKYEKETCKI